ncbi:MAG: hypothetical protein QM756_40970 [Polyangiaceae bacterium]
MRRAAPFVLLLCAACSRAPDAKSHERSEAVAASAHAEAAKKSLFERDTLERAIGDILARLSSSAGILSIELLPERARFVVQSDTPDAGLVEYEWQAGELRGPTRLEIRGKGTLQQNLFLASSLDFASLPALLDLSRARVDAENGSVSRVLIRRNLPIDDSVGMRVYVDSPIRSSHVDADAHGRPVEPGKYP